MKNFVFDRPSVLGDKRSVVFARSEAIARHASRAETLQKVIKVCERLAPDEFTEVMIDAYRAGNSKFGESWGYMDIATLLYAVAELGQPEDYLEIGVRRGRSSCMVAAASPSTSIFAFDLWQEDYAANDNPGPEFVSGELDKFGHRGSRHFVSGDSHTTVPKFAKDNPGKQFDLITVDGDHSLEGAWADLNQVVALLRVGGVIVFDDIDNPYCPGLDQVWERFLLLHTELSGITVPNAFGLGVGLAVRLWPPGHGPKAAKSTGVKAWLKR